ncbi:ABC transporter substrate-binding protein [Methylobacterium oxalidis]|uniref:Peptide ABC transporter substrate-binding protein n=1 Tax=Methylobacterium oxalidis TaxID=944322 RepID=A0A512J5J7_9HYPH|nr:ABC transporter substrate-binding protein [Methylobacterium oxalidis]GEP05246.1 peptide ABC transporter substrate-binding protein [Methylobacterium oxalidis]GJE29946.1 Periplasmic alpha-galactoside-binding protein [Methylobacterium oxalidis]GLS64710.1 peptide ABC transporter substrate-binding protein [Methylobacterium oxalidis]
MTAQPPGGSGLSRRALLAGLGATCTLGPRAAGAIEAGPPATPLVVDLAARGRKVGAPGGTVRTLIAKARDVRYLSVYGYTRLVGYGPDLTLRPDVLERVDVEGGAFTFHLRAGHRWSDGTPFTTEDFRYFWEDVANDPELSPGGPPDFFLVEGRPPRVEVPDERTIRYLWERPNPRFLPALAAPRDPLIYRPAHYLKPFHPRYAGREAAEAAARDQKLRGWTALHNRLDDNYELGNPDCPTLQAWRPRTRAPATRFAFERNPHYHRVDPAGTQLPYLDRIVMDVSASGLLAAKTNAGEADLMFRGLMMTDIPSLKEGEAAHGYRTNLWPIARGTEIALYPNLTTLDPVWRRLNRDVRYRRALSLAIDRRTLNNTLLFGLGTEGNNTVVPESPLFSPELRTLHAAYDPGEAGRLLDAAGLSRRDAAGIRLMEDGRTLDVVAESDGEAAMVLDGLLLIAEFWREVGIRLMVKPQERTNLRRRSVAGLTVMVAAQGLDLAVPTAIMPPAELTPAQPDHYAWPRWSLNVESRGRSGEPCDVPEVERLIALEREWRLTDDTERQGAIWREMLRNHAENQWVIGTVAGALQPVVAMDRLANLPERALYSWDPTALIGVQRLDEVFWDGAAERRANAR